MDQVWLACKDTGTVLVEHRVDLRRDNIAEDEGLAVKLTPGEYKITANYKPATLQYKSYTLKFWDLDLEGPYTD